MTSTDYRLDEQIGFLLRRASQRHSTIFKEQMLDGLTPRQFATLAKLLEVGPLSQNRLGRATAMDAATIKGVVDRLTARDLVASTEDPIDRRRRTVSLTAKGERLARRCTKVALGITATTLDGLSPDEQAILQRLLRSIAEA